ncbi:MAG: small multi-drug export protein [Bacillota bacterium]
MPSFLTRELLVLWVATLPVVELRGAIPLGISLGMPPLEAFFLGVVGNLMPVPALLLLLEPACRSIRRWRPVRRLFDRVLERNRSRSEKLRRWGLVGLGLFVAIPLPTTGVWSGSLVASMMGLKFWPSMIALSAGALVAGALVTTLSYLGLVTTP